MFNEKKINDIMNRFIDCGTETGAAAVVMKNGEELYRYSCGLADAEKGRAFREDTICKAFSCSKVITGTAAMQLLESGLIELDNRLEWYIPEFADAAFIENGKRIPVSRPITLRDLLDMTSGIAYPGDGREGGQEISDVWGELDAGTKEGRQMSTLEFAHKAGKCAVMFDAGEQWSYGSSADIFGAVVETVTGKRYGDYLKENIFEPLGMADTAFYCPKDKLDRLAVLYEGAGENRKVLDWVNLCIYDYTEEPAFQSGGAGIFTTAEDLAKLGAALSNGSYKGVRVLGRKTVEFMRMNALTKDQRRTFDWDSCRGFGYANFVRILEDPNKASLIASKGSFGWDGWTGTYMLVDPDEKLSTVLFVQRAGAGTTSLSKAVVNAVYSMI